MVGISWIQRLLMVESKHCVCSSSSSSYDFLYRSFLMIQGGCQVVNRSVGRFRFGLRLQIQPMIGQCLGAVLCLEDITKMNAITTWMVASKNQFVDLLLSYGYGDDTCGLSQRVPCL